MVSSKGALYPDPLLLLALILFYFCSKTHIENQGRGTVRACADDIGAVINRLILLPNGSQCLKDIEISSCSHLLCDMGTLEAILQY